MCQFASLSKVWWFESDDEVIRPSSVVAVSMQKANNLSASLGMIVSANRTEVGRRVPASLESRVLAEVWWLEGWRLSDWAARVVFKTNTISQLFTRTLCLNFHGMQCLYFHADICARLLVLFSGRVHLSRKAKVQCCDVPGRLPKAYKAGRWPLGILNYLLFWWLVINFALVQDVGKWCWKLVYNWFWCR